MPNSPKTISCHTDWLRDVILGKIKHRKCPNCDNEGLTYSLCGDSYLPYHPPEWGDQYHIYDCEVCDGVGFVEIPDDLP